MREGFLTDISTAMLFFRICSRYKIVDHENRLALMRELTRRKKAKYIRDGGAFLRGKKVVQIKHNAGPEHFCPECRPKEK